MTQNIYQVCQHLGDERQPYVLATVIRVTGSASAKPGSKAVIDAKGRNLCGWVGGGCAEGLVREEALKALAERQTRIVRVDLDDEVLGVGMPCGGNMEVYLEPRLPPRQLVICGHNRLARHLSALAALLGYSVSVHAPDAREEHFPTADQIERAAWSDLSLASGATVLIAGDHEEHATVLGRVLETKPASVAMVASRKIAQGVLSALRRAGHSVASLAAVRAPAGLDLNAATLEDISFSIFAELLAQERQCSARSLAGVIDTPEQAAGSPAWRAQEHRAKKPPPVVIVGHGRLAEELARLAALAGWPMTVNAVEANASEFPAAACVITGDLDFSRLGITPETHAVIATLHKGDHLSMQRVLEGRAAYAGLIASRRRSGLILDFLKEKGFSASDLARVHAPAGLDLGALNPTEIAFSTVCEMIAVHRGGTGRPLAELEAFTAPGSPGACKQLFQ